MKNGILKPALLALLLLSTSAFAERHRNFYDPSQNNYNNNNGGNSGGGGGGFPGGGGGGGGFGGGEAKGAEKGKEAAKEFEEQAKQFKDEVTKVGEGFSEQMEKLTENFSERVKELTPEDKSSEFFEQNRERQAALVESLPEPDTQTYVEGMIEGINTQAQIQQQALINQAAATVQNLQVQQAAPPKRTGADAINEFLANQKEDNAFATVVTHDTNSSALLSDASQEDSGHFRSVSSVRGVTDEIREQAYRFPEDILQ